MDKQLVDAFIKECKQKQEWEQQWEANHIQMENFFKVSGKTEKINEKYREILAEVERFKKASLIKVAPLPQKSRKEYFKQYWLQQKLK